MGDAPVAPMLARLTRALPRDGYVYEPKWDGFRCLAAREGAEVALWSRHGRPFARYSLRATSPPGVSTPLRWEEVEALPERLDPTPRT
jgi:ATP-dependent DNA ligase